MIKANPMISTGDGENVSMPSLPLEGSVGHQIRITHRYLQRALQARIAPLGVTTGMWWFLRVLWNEDGLTQRELSRRVGTSEPTTRTAIQAMEGSGYVHRVWDTTDRRKLSITLTNAGRALERKLLPAGIEVVAIATKGFTVRERDFLLGLLAAIQRNLSSDLGSLSESDGFEDLGE
jgi:DNA-binding MarR family transcriptional regulator